MSKEIIFNNTARERIKEGIDVAANAVKLTIGPMGRNVVIEKSFGGPNITNDGVSIVKEISLEDRFQNMGVEMVKEVANKTNDLAGDGTSTTVVLFSGLVDEGYKEINKGNSISAMDIRKGMEIAAQDAVDRLKGLSNPISNREDIEKVATISAESSHIGRIIADTIEKVGKDGVVSVEESKTFGISQDVVVGMEIDSGFVSPYMITNSDRAEAEYTDVPILVTDSKITSIKEILPFLEKFTQAGSKELVLIADDIDGEALTTFVLNKLRGTFNVLAIKTPGFGDGKKESLADIAALVGANIVSADLGMKFDNIGLDVLGSAKRVTSRKEKTVIIPGDESHEQLDKYIGRLQHQIHDSESEYEKGKITGRIAKLKGGVAVIRVGASTETEMKYLKAKIEDGVNATKAAVAEGVVPGGGASLVRVANKIYPKENLTKDERRGYEIVQRAFEFPMRQILDNADVSATGIIKNIKKGEDLSGYDVKSGDFVKDMIVRGVIDPVKVTRSAIQNAVSAAAIFLTTECAVAEIQKDKNEELPNPMGGIGDIY